MSSSIVVDGVEYGKPNMAALEGEWGRRIVEQIARSPRPDYERLEREAKEIRDRLIREVAEGVY